jgi:photosystem II stability/assembly factor-like uncharacterized protein
MSNSSSSWTAKNSGITNLNVRAIAIKSDGTLFAGTYGNGVFRSSDGGESWIPINKGLYYMDIRKISFTNQENFLLAATYGGGIYRSGDNGASWVKMNTGLKSLFINDLAMNGAGVIFAATDGQGIMQSIDHGATWRDLDTTLKDRFTTCVAFNSDGKLIVGTRSWGIYWYDDVVYLTWQKTDMPLVGISAIIKSANGTMFSIKPFDGLYKSTDKGLKWIQTGFKMLKGINPLRVNQYNGDIYAYVPEKQVYRTSNKGKSWIPYGMDDVSIIDFAFSPNNNVFCIANNGGGLSLYSPSSSTWSRIAFKDSMTSCMAINSNGVLFVSVTGIVVNPPPTPPTKYPYLCRTDNSGATWTKLKPYDSAVITSIAIKSNNDIYITNGSGLMKSVNNGDTWTNITGATGINLINSIKLNSKGHIFLTSSYGIYKSIDDGASWTHYDFGVTVSEIGAIAINTSDYVFAGSNTGIGMYLTKNNGTKWDSLNYEYIFSDVKSMSTYTDGMTYMATNVIYHSIDPAKLAQAELVSPADNGVGIPTIAPLIWKSVPNAELYEVQLSDKVDFSYRIEFATQSDTFRLTTTNLKSNTQYYWRVRSKCHSAVGTWSTARNFTTSIQSPDLVSPENGKKGVTQTYNFQWSRVDGATKYYLIVSKDAQFTTKAYEKDNIPDTCWLVPGLEPLTRYYWKVKAKSDITVSGFSETWTFLTVLAPPILRKPANHSMDLAVPVIMTWDTVSAGTKYSIQVATDDQFEHKVYDGKADNNFQHQLSLLDYNTKYYWHVQAENGDGVSLFSTTWDYTMGISPAILLSPDNESFNQDTSVILRWDAVDNRTYYHLEVSTDSKFATLLVNDSTLTDNNYELKGIKYYADYYWRVRVLIDKRKGFWSNVWTFKTKLSKVILTSPVNDAIEQDIKLYLRWQSLQGAKYYHLQVSTDEAFADVVVDKDSLLDTYKDIYDLKYDTKYFWHVLGYNAQGQSIMSDVWNFKTTANVGVEEPNNIILSAIAYPNPFISAVNIVYSLKSDTKVKISILNLLGEEILSLSETWQTAGEHITEWHPSDLPQGEYYYRITAGTDVLSGGLIFIK